MTFESVLGEGLIVARPPVVEASIFIKGSSVSIESMRNLMGDDRPIPSQLADEDCAGHGRLQDSRWKDNQVFGL